MSATQKAAHHSPEPWTWVPCETDLEWDESEVVTTPANLKDTNGKSVFTVDTGEYLGLSDANARRIVACVNACEGIPTEALEGGVVREMIETLTWARNVVGNDWVGLMEVLVEKIGAVLAKLRSEASSTATNHDEEYEEWLRRAEEERYYNEYGREA